jgi:hypothetical protein
LFILSAFLAWAGDWITIEGERTIYTVECTGQWQQLRCSGRLIAGARYRYRALRAHKEVLFWIAGSGEPVGKLTDCDIRNGRNWKCPVGEDADRSMTLEMAAGRAVHDASGNARSFHATTKVKWWLMRWDMQWFRSATY